MKRTAERTEFLSDIIIAAVEGGTGYWAQVSQYQYVYDGEVHVYVGKRQGDQTRATLHEMNDDGDGYKAEGLDLTIDKIASALGKIVRGDVGTGERFRRRMAEASRENDAGDIDADDADTIAQIALLGEEVYG